MTIPGPGGNRKYTANERVYQLCKVLNVATIGALVVMVAVGGFPGRWIFAVFLLFVASCIWTVQAYGDVRDEKLPPFPQPDHAKPRQFSDFKDDTGADL